MTSKKIKSIVLLFCVFFTFPIFFSMPDGMASPAIMLRTSSDTSESVILSSNLVRNFKFTSFGGVDIIDNTAFGGKLKFEMLPTWQLSEDDVDLISGYVIGDKLYLYYQVALTNMINIYTNVKLEQAAPNGLDKKVTNVEVLRVYRVPFWANTKHGFTSRVDKLSYQHYDFGDIHTYNSLQNTFSGDLRMEFDIDDNPVPNVLTDSLGNSHEKQFAYISLSSAGVESVDWGMMSKNMPVVQGISVSDFITPERNDYTTTLKPDDLKYSVQPTLTVFSNYSTSFGEALQFQSEGSSMNPKTKEGEDLWSPESEESMKNGSITFNVGSISPQVYLWESRLDYTWWEFIHYEHLVFMGTKWSTTKNHAARSLTEDSALHLINRYAQVEMKLVFDVYACFELDVAKNSLNKYNLGLPKEWYDEMVWTSTVEGTTSGDIATPPSWNFFEDIFGLFGGIGNFIVFIVIAIIAILALYLAIRIVPRLIPKRRDKNTTS